MYNKTKLQSAVLCIIITTSSYLLLASTARVAVINQTHLAIVVATKKIAPGTFEIMTVPQPRVLVTFEKDRQQYYRSDLGPVIVTKIPEALESKTAHARAH